MSDFWDFLCEFILPFGIVMGIIAGGGGIIYTADRIDCSGFETATGTKTEYHGFTCYAQVQGQWVPKQYVFGDAHEVRLKAKQ